MYIIYYNSKLKQNLELFYVQNIGSIYQHEGWPQIDQVKFKGKS
jgi:hypothetical protein